MGVAQHKLGPVMVETPLRGFPITFSVTVGTLLAQSPLVLVILLVTGETVFRRLLEHAAQVATLAFNFGMFAKQGETALIMVKFGWLLPIALVVTTGAVLAQGLLVLVVLGMAGIAFLAQLDAVELTAVAARTSGRAMLATQGVLGVVVVIKAAGFPLVRAVAAFAFLTEQALVTFAAVIILLVAGNAIAWRIFVAHRLVLVASGAFGICVLAGQGKASRGMVKLGFFPTVLAVTIGAL